MQFAVDVRLTYAARGRAFFEVGALDAMRLAAFQRTLCAGPKLSRHVAAFRFDRRRAVEHRFGITTDEPRCRPRRREPTVFLRTERNGHLTVRRELFTQHFVVVVTAIVATASAE